MIDKWGLTALTAISRHAIARHVIARAPIAQHF